MDGKMFGKNLRILRMNKGLSQNALSKLSGVNKNTIVKYENGNAKRPDMRYAQQLADFFGVSLDYFERDDNKIRFEVVEADYPLVSQCRRVMEKAEYQYKYLEKAKEQIDAGEISEADAEKVAGEIKKRETVLHDFEKLLIEAGNALMNDDIDELSDYFEKLSMIADYYGTMKGKMAESKEMECGSVKTSYYQEMVDISYNAFLNSVRKSNARC